MFLKGRKGKAHLPPPAFFLRLYADPSHERRLSL